MRFIEKAATVRTVRAYINIIFISILAIPQLARSEKVDSLNISLISRFQTTSTVEGVYIRGDFGYISTANGGFLTLDLADLLNPRQVGYVDLVGFGGVIKVEGNYAYLANWDRGLRIVDISNPNNPTEVGYFDTEGHSQDLQVRNSICYIADRENGLVVIDAHDPRNPQLLGHFNTAAWARGLDINSNYVYLGQRNYRLSVIDISNPGSMREISSVNLPGEPRGVYYTNGLSFVSCRWHGFSVVDVHDVNNLRVVRNYQDTTYVLWVIAHLPYVFTLSSHSIKVFQMNDDTSFSVIGYYNFSPEATNFFVRGNLIYVGTSSGLMIFSVSGISVSEQSERENPVAIFPTIINGKLNLDGSDLRKLQISILEIYSLNGRRYLLKVNNRNEINLSSGLYIFRWLDIRKSWKTQKILVIK